MKKFGLIGHPIAHSLSPALFKAAYGGEYTYELIEGEDFESSYQRFIGEYDAINVTAPFKGKAYAKADTATGGCKAVGAANILLKRPDGRIEAANSDVTGVIGAITSAGPLTGTGTDALIVGCGGAAMAAAYATGSLGYRTVILNRNCVKAKEFAARLSGETGFEVTAEGLDSFNRHFRRAGVIIYTLPVAIPAIEILKIKDIRGCSLWGRKPKLILEANYRDPAFTPELIERLKKANPLLQYIDGKEWLLHQAVDAYISFTGEEPNITQMRKVL